MRSPYTEYAAGGPTIPSHFEGQVRVVRDNNHRWVLQGPSDSEDSIWTARMPSL